MTDSTRSDQLKEMLSEEGLLQGAIEKYQEAMGYRQEMSLRVARRMTVVIRGIIGVFALVLISLFLLVAVLINHMNDLINTVDTMNYHFTSMTKNMKEMRQNVASMERSMKVMPTIVNEVDGMTSNVLVMSGSMNVLADKMDKINSHMSVMDNDINVMANTFQQMESTVRRIDVDVNEMSSPMRRSY